MANNSIATTNMTLAEVMDEYVTEAFGFRPRTLLLMYSAFAALALLGVVGNVVSMVIWTRPQVKSSSSVLLTALAGCDLFILIAVHPMSYIGVLLFNYLDSPAITYISKFILPYVQVCSHPVYLTVQTASIYLTLAITFERYIVVCRPFQARLVCTCSRACKYAVAIITFSTLFNQVHFMMFQVVDHLDDDGNILYYNVVETKLSQSLVYSTIYELYRTWLSLILIFLLPLICTAVLNTLIYLEMKRMKKRRQAMTSSQRKENRLTTMLVYVTFEFLVCSSVSLTSIIINIFEISEEQLGFKPILLLPLQIFFDTFNSSSNFLTYVVFGSLFRETLLSTFSCCRGFCGLRLQNRTAPHNIRDFPLSVGTADGNQTADNQVRESC